MNEEQIAKAREAKSVEELLALAKENGMEMTEEEAADLYERLHSSTELTDEELENVAGGGCGTSTVKVDGVSHAIVSCDSACRNGNYEFLSYKHMWDICDNGKCGNCAHYVGTSDWNYDGYCAIPF